MKLGRWFLAILTLALVFPAFALADATAPQHTLALPTDEVWVVVAGALAPIVGYLLNYFGPHIDERVKGIVHVVVAAIAGGIVQAVTAGGVGLNARTLQFVVIAVASALAAHAGFYTRSTWSTTLGGGRNAQTERR